MPLKLSRVFDILRERKILNKIGVLASLSVIAVAVYVLFHALRGLRVDEVYDAILATSPRSIALAALFVAAGYFTLTFYDLFALRTIGREDVPYRIAALAGFTSYSIGHNVGASVFTGGAVRFRIYSQWNLDAVEVAKICFVAGLTFWLGNAAVLGLGIATHPEAASAVDLIPPWLNRALALMVLGVLLIYIGWVSIKPREIGRAHWSVTLPGGNLTLLQILIGIIDLTFCALAMYMLMPGVPKIEFLTVAVIFVSATLLGFVSHSPGGLGVFDAAMIVGLAQFDREHLLASMLLFRVLYYLTPFVLALCVLGVFELRQSMKRRKALPASPPLAPIQTDVERGNEPAGMDLPRHD